MPKIDAAYLAHCIKIAPEVDLRSPHALCVIDGAILGALPVNVEHAYRKAHHRDNLIMSRTTISL